MRYLQVTRDASAALRFAVAVAGDAIRAGGLVVFPTDTLYGLAADPHRSEAVRRLFALKQRRAGQALPLVAADRDQVERYAGVLGGLPARLAAAFWPGPLTLILPAWPGLADDVDGGTGGIGVRVPDDTVARALAAAAGTPVIATSANRSGEPPVSLASHIPQVILDGVDVVLDAGPTPGGLPSTVVEVRGSHPRLVRAGAIAWERVLEFG